MFRGSLLTAAVLLTVQTVSPGWAQRYAPSGTRPGGSQPDAGQPGGGQPGGPPAAAAVGAYTYHGDNMRLGWNQSETALSPAAVATRFGKRWSRPVDGQVYAQPLYAPAVKMGASGTHNVVLVATEHNSVYAFDADVGGDAPLWQVSLGPSVPEAVVGCPDIQGPEYGITSTPVLDPNTQTLFVVADTWETGQQIYRLHALDISTGQSRPGWPVLIQGAVMGDGGGSVGGSIVFDPSIQHQRAGLLLLNGHVLIAFGSRCDLAIDRYHGWIFSYSALDPSAPPSVFNTTPDPPLPGQMTEGAGGLWQAGFGLAADEAGNVYFEVGNGLFNVDHGGRNVGDCIVRLSTAGGLLTYTPDPANFFTPSNQKDLDDADLDLGSGGAMVLPNQPGTTTPRLLVGGGKDGVLRLLNRDWLGGFTGQVNPQALDSALQDTPNPLPSRGGIYCGPAYWEGPGGHYLFITGNGLPLRRFRLGTNGAGGSALSADLQSGDVFRTHPAPTPVVSSSGQAAGTGIVWVLRRDDNTLRAYNAEDLTLLWSSDRVAGGGLDGGVVKFSVPAVANGAVYVGTKEPAETPGQPGGNQGHILCYGLR